MHYLSISAIVINFPAVENLNMEYTRIFILSCKYRPTGWLLRVYEFWYSEGVTKVLIFAYFIKYIDLYINEYIGNI